MRAIHDLIASSRHEHLVLYDPAAIPADLPVDPDLEAQDPRPAPPSAINDLATSGRALVVRVPLEDCEATMRLVVDDDVDDYLLQRGAAVLTGAMLHVPSGELRADGVEFIVRTGEVRTDSDAESCRLPAGDYEVEVLELINWKIESLAAEVAAGTTRLERLCDRVIQPLVWCGALLIPGNILLAPAAIVIAWNTRGWRSALLVAAIVIAIDMVILGGFWVLERTQRRFGALSRVSDLRRSLERAHPDLVVSLRTARERRAPGAPAFATLHVNER